MTTAMTAESSGAGAPVAAIWSTVPEKPVSLLHPNRTKSTTNSTAPYCDIVGKTAVSVEEPGLKRRPHVR